MKVKELKAKLEKYPDNLEVFVPSSTGDYEYGKVYSMYQSEIKMPNDDILDALIIDEQ